MAAHAPGDVERRRAGDRIRVARGQHKHGRDPHRAADADGVEAAQFRAGRGGGQQRHLAVLMRQRARREAGGEPAGDLIAEHEGGEDVAAGTAGLLSDRQHPGQDLQCRLAGDETQSFAQLDRAAGDAVEQGRRAGILDRPTAGIDRRTGPGGGGESLAQLPHFGPPAAGQDDAERVEQRNFCVSPHRFGHVLPARPRDESRQFLDLPSHAVAFRFQDRPS